MGLTTDEIVALYRLRLMDAGPLHSAAKEVADTYHGDIVIPLPEMDRDEKRAVPNLLAQGANQLAMRISSTTPDVFYPPDRPGFKNSEEQARTKRKANLGWWEHSNMKLVDGRRARQLLCFATAPVLIRPDFNFEIPIWQIRHPLHTYPAAVPNPDDVHPDDCIFTFTRPLAWLLRQYPDKAAALSKGDKPSGDKKFTLLEYVDGEDFVLIVLGEQAGQYDTVRGAPHVELERTPNRGDGCPAVVPGRITLDRRQGAFDGMVGLYQRQAKLMALEAIAVEQGVFPDEWLVSRPNETAAIIREADGRAGIRGIVKGGEVTSMVTNPSYKTDQTISQLERYQKMEGGIPDEFMGQSTTGVRTGRRGDSILSAVVDFPVQEAQRIFETSKEAENRVAIGVARGYFGDKSKSFYVNWKGAKGFVDYTPNKDFISDANIVTYAHAGADVNSLIIGIGQMIGVGLISTELGRELNPMIDDPEREHDRVVVESLEKALLMSLDQGAGSGAIAPSDLARIMELVSTNAKDLAGAIQQVQQEAQARQATSGPPGTPTGPVPAGAPEAQPGISAPGSSAQAGAIQASPDESGLAGLMAALRGGAAGS